MTKFIPLLDLLAQVEVQVEAEVHVEAELEVHYSGVPLAVLAGVPLAVLAEVQSAKVWTGCAHHLLAETPANMTCCALASLHENMLEVHAYNQCYHSLYKLYCELDVAISTS